LYPEANGYSFLKNTDKKKEVKAFGSTVGRNCSRRVV
jgi:hypothetical protein